jgi:tRNA1Val (adenine37-N6)-methyltransferase
MTEEETLDEILDGRLQLFQKKKGYRFSLDSILLAHFELGCCNGITLLVLAKRFPNVHFAGLEIQENLAALARKNSQINDLEDRIEIHSGDARDIKKAFPARSFDTAIFNPPYRKLNSGRINPLQEKAIARHEIIGSLKDFLTAAKYLLNHSGTVFTIYPAKRSVELIYLFRNSGIEPKKMRLIFSDNSSEAELILVEGKKGGREEMKIEPSLFIYDQNRNYTAEISGIFNELSRFPSDGDG